MHRQYTAWDKVAQKYTAHCAVHMHTVCTQNIIQCTIHNAQKSCTAKCTKKAALAQNTFYKIQKDVAKSDDIEQKSLF